MLLVILMEGKLLERITKKSCKKQIEENSIKEKKRKFDKLCVKWKRYDNSFNIWIDKEIHSINELIFSRTEIFRRESES